MSLRWLPAMAAGVLAGVTGCAQCETCADFPPVPPFAYEEGMVVAPPLRYGPNTAGPVMMMNAPGMPAASGTPTTPATAPPPNGSEADAKPEASASGNQGQSTPPAPTSTPMEPPGTLPLTPPSSGLEPPPELPMPNLDNPTAMIVPIP